MTNRTALETLLVARTPALLRTAYLLTGNGEAARDLLQTALERVARRLSDIKEPQALESYLRATMATTAANERKRFWHRELTAASMPEVVSQSEDVDTRLVLQRALMTLPPDQRAVLVLRFYEDLTEAQTAAVLDIAVGTVKSRASRALQHLRDAGIALVQEGSV